MLGHRRCASTEMKKRQIVHKTANLDPLPGSLHTAFVRCGKPTCRCARGQLHGPYWRHQWREGRHIRRRYVRQADVPRVQAALAAWREQHPSVTALRRNLTEIRRLMRLLGV